MADPYVSEVKYLGSGNVDFVEIAVDAGTDVSNITVTIYHASGAVRSVNSLGSLVTTISGKDVYIIDKATSATFNGLHKQGAVAIDVNGTVVQFISFDDGSPVTATGGAAAGMTSTQIGQAGAGESLETTDGGGSYVVQTAPNSGTIPCFTPGTRIRTPDSQIAVENIEPGQAILTRDHGAQTVRWIGRRHVTAMAVRANDRLRPVMIRAGALGPGLPARDMAVSRQHRMLLAGPLVREHFALDEILVPAIKLLPLPGFSVDPSGRAVDYVHLLFDRHEVIWADNAPSESMLAGPQAQAALGGMARREAFAACPNLFAAPRPARPVIERRRDLDDFLAAYSAFSSGLAAAA
ncbi:MAG: Hint domain-containing protein [Marinibacterium sp.]